MVMLAVQLQLCVAIHYSQVLVAPPSSPPCSQKGKTTTVTHQQRTVLIHQLLWVPQKAEADVGLHAQPTQERRSQKTMVSGAMPPVLHTAAAMLLGDADGWLQVPARNPRIFTTLRP